MADGTITLFPRDAELLPLRSGPVGFLFACARDGTAYGNYPSAVPVEELVGEFGEHRGRASTLARRLLSGEPEIGGVQQLAVFEEVICNELQNAFRLLRLHDYLLEAGYSRCRFDAPSRFARDLAELAAHLGSNLAVSYPNIQRDASAWDSVSRSFRRLVAAGFGLRMLSREWRQALDRIDPFRRRSRTGPRSRPQRHGGLWFYSTAYTFTGIGLLFEPYFPRPFQFLVENPFTGGNLLRASGRKSVSPYAFGTRAMEPSGAELAAARADIAAHLESIPLGRGDRAALHLLKGGDFYRTFLARHLRDGIYSSALFGRWADVSRPAALVVGNFVFEAYALKAARKRGIPTLLLQHGTLGEDYQLIDPPVDRIAVRGTFWRDFLPAGVRSRALALNPPVGRGESAGSREIANAIVFITTPYDLLEWRHASDLDDIVEVLYSSALEHGCELILRVHPLEEIEHYKLRIRRAAQRRPGAAKVTYSQGAGLDEILGRAAVAVLYSSTVLLDCLRLRVPMVSFAWHDFDFRRRGEEEGLFHFAGTLAELKALIGEGMKGGLSAYPGNLEPFLAHTPEKALREILAGLVAGAATARRESDP